MYELTTGYIRYCSYHMHNAWECSLRCPPRKDRILCVIEIKRSYDFAANRGQWRVFHNGMPYAIGSYRYAGRFACRFRSVYTCRIHHHFPTRGLSTDHNVPSVQLQSFHSSQHHDLLCFVVSKRNSSSPTCYYWDTTLRILLDNYDIEWLLTTNEWMGRRILKFFQKDIRTNSMHERL